MGYWKKISKMRNQQAKAKWELLKKPKTWLWLAVGTVAGTFAFGIIGAMAGFVAGLYIAKHIDEK